MVTHYTIVIKTDGASSPMPFLAQQSSGSTLPIIIKMKCQLNTGQTQKL